MTGLVRTDGFDAVAVGPDVADPVTVTALLEPDAANEDSVLRDGFALRTAMRRATALIALGRELRPDVVVCDEVDYGAAIAAERLGIPAAPVLVLVAGSFARTELLRDPLNVVRAHFGLDADPELRMLHRHLVLAPFPLSFRDDAYPLPTTAFRFRPAALETENVSADTNPWFVSALPHIYVTLGTIFTMESGDLFERILQAAAALPVEVIATVGRQRDPLPFAERWPNVRVERYIAQAELLPRSDLVVCHGGSGSVIGSVAHGVPLLLFPMGADQPHNAARCVALGVGRVLDPVRADVDTIRGAIAAMITEAGPRGRAAVLRSETLALPEVAAVIPRLEALV